MYKLLLCLLLLNSVYTCDDKVKFKDPQPSGRRNILSVPVALQGTYISEDEEYYLSIDKSNIIEWTSGSINTLKDSLDYDIDSTKIVHRKNNTIEIIDESFKINLTYTKDSVSGHYTLTDTLFKVCPDQLLRKYKGHYFLNTKKADSEWELRMLTIKQDTLIISKVNHPDDIEAFNQVTPTEILEPHKGNKSKIRIDPKRNAFKKIMRDYVAETDRYIRSNE